MTRTVKQPTSVQKLHQVLAPRVTKPTRSTKPLTLPDDFELQTTRRGQGRPAQQPVRGLVLDTVSSTTQHATACSEQTAVIAQPLTLFALRHSAGEEPLQAAG